MANVDIKSYNEILGNMIRKIIADTPANDINVGSVLLTLLEAAASNDYENNTAILNVLELFNMDVIRNNDLDAYASNLGLTRTTALKASGFVSMSDSSITKRSTSLYPIKPAPIRGTSILYVNDATGWSTSGNVYIGRGTANFEGPLPYTSIIDNGTFFAISLSVSLDKDHLLSESVIDGQGTTDRQITAGTKVRIPANNISPEIEYVTLRDAVIAAGEDKSDSIPVVAVNAGSESNAGINTITLFSTPPFSGAKVTNTNAFINGKDTESDDSFRDRIKAYSSSLARGTKQSILTAVKGVSDETDGKQVESAVITEPAFIGDPSILYVDDGQGFEPSYEGQSVDLLIASASGNEEFLQLANYPIPRPQCSNNTDAPFLLLDGMELKVSVDGVEESVVFSSLNFKNISSVTIYEIITTINSKSASFKCRLTENSTRLLLYPLNHKAETIQVVSDGTSLDANTALKFPTNEFSYIKLYQNNKLLKEVEKPAYLTSTPFSTWDISVSGNLVVSVDGTPDQDRTFSVTDFGVTTFTSITLNDWVTIFNTKYAGVTASSTSSGRMILTSNKEGELSTLEIVGGTYIEKMFGGQNTVATGQNSDFILNRQNGNMQIKTIILAGDVITAGSSDTRGSILSNSASGGNFNVAVDPNGRPAEIVIVADGARVLPRYLNIPVSSTITITDQGSSIMRIMSSVSSSFKSVQPGDYIYIASRGETRVDPLVDPVGSGTWLDAASCGLYKVEAKGEQLASGIDTYVEVKNAGIITGGAYPILDSLDIQSFFSDVYPQIWKGSYTSSPAAANIQEVVASINSSIKNVEAKVFRTNYIKLMSSTEGNGSIAVPISIGAASQVFLTGQGQVSGTQSHIASRVPQKDALTIFKRSEPVSENVWLDRHVYSEVKGSFTSESVPSLDGTGTFSETIIDAATIDFQTQASYDDSVIITSGSNRSQLRNIRSIVDASNLGTRHNTPRTLMDYTVGDEYQLVKNLEISYDDNLVAILDKDAIAKTIDISFSRTGQINSGSQSLTYIPTNLAFSANDANNEPGVDFGTLGVWGTLASQSSTNFNDYAVWFKARNWYTDNGVEIILRAKEFGPIGDKVRFNVDYPSAPNASGVLVQSVTAESTAITYFFGSDAVVSTNVSPGDLFTMSSLGSYMFRLAFPVTASVSSANVNDVITIGDTSGFSSANSGTFRIAAKNDTNKTIDIYNPNGVATIVGSPVVHRIQCVADTVDSLNGTYFVLNASNGDTVKFWYDNNNAGTIEPAIGTTTRSWEINISTGDSDITVATLTAASILNDIAFSTATNISGTSSLITINNTSNGPALQGINGTPSPAFAFTLVTAGISATYETLNIISQIQVYPIKENDSATIVSKINSNNTLEAVNQTFGSLYKATKDITDVAVGVAAYGHNPSPVSGLNSYVSLWDSKNWILSYQNSNPNFQLKKPMVLSGVSSVYQVDTTNNIDGSQGEIFKLVPVTLSNLKHHITHKALSQLDIVSDIAFANDNKKLQIKSQLLGSQGAIEVVGGRANSAAFKLIGDSQVSTVNGSKYLEFKIPASPNTLSPGQHVLLSNDSGVERFDRMISTDTMDVKKFSDVIFDYVYNNKNTYFNEYTKFTIVDANSVDPTSYPTIGVAWRWMHDDSGSYAVISDKVVGIIASQPQVYNTIGTLGGATNVHRLVTSAGSISTSLSFKISCSGQPIQGDYVTFQNSTASTWAVWFSIDSNLSAPSGLTFSSATNKTRVDILSSDTPNQIISKFLSKLLTSGISTVFNTTQTPGASLSDVTVGSLVNAFSSNGVPSTGWSGGNYCMEAGSSKISGLPIVKVDADNKYFDVANPNGKAMLSTEIGTSTILISSTPIIEWKLAHSSRIKIDQVVISTNVATATTNAPHGLSVGDVFTGIQIPSMVLPDTGIVTQVVSLNEFKYASTNSDTAISPAGSLIRSDKTRTRYKLQSLGFNGTVRLSRHDGDSPKFLSCGVAVDDLLILSGESLGSVNSGEFRVLAVDEDSVVYQNENAQEQLNTLVPFNDDSIEVAWTANSSLVTGVAGAFANLNIGDWVKKVTDDDTMYVQVSAFNSAASLATILTLASEYAGVGGSAPSHALDQNDSINTGVYLKDIRDITVLEGDSVRVGDSIFITENTSPNWFASANSGSFIIKDLGTSALSGLIYLRANNASGVEESAVDMGTINTRFSITESESNLFTSIRQISHIAIDEANTSRRIMYLSGGDRGYKWNQTNSTSVSSLGKIAYIEDLTSGIDGYQYYTGLLRKVQRIIDGFEPDSVSFPGRKAVGSAIEILPPLPVRVSVSLDITTQDGVNLSEISDEISSVIINYVSDLGVGEDVILSDIIVRVKNIAGVAAVTFITPAPSNERIAVSDSEKAFIEPTDISIT